MQGAVALISRQASLEALWATGDQRKGAEGVYIYLFACRHLRDHARTIPGKAQQFMIAFAKALEVIPRQLCDNAGFDATDVLNKLRQKHALKDGSGKNFGVDVNTGGRCALETAYITMHSPCDLCCRLFFNADEL